MQQELEVGIKTLRYVPKSLQMHFRYHVIEGSEMLPGDLDRHLVWTAGIITVKHIPRSMWNSNFRPTTERWRGFGKLLKTYRHSNSQKCCHWLQWIWNFIMFFYAMFLKARSAWQNSCIYFIFNISSGVCWRPTRNIHNCILELCKKTHEKLSYFVGFLFVGLFVCLSEEIMFRYDELPEVI